MIKVIIRSLLVLAVLLPLRAKEEVSCVTASKGIHAMPALSPSRTKAESRNAIANTAAAHESKKAPVMAAYKPAAPTTKVANTPVPTSLAVTKTTSKPAITSVAPAVKSTISTSKVAKISAPTDLPVTPAEPGRTTMGGRLARLTAYWAGEGDYYTGRCLSSTGIHLHGGHCAVDPSIIPYGSVVEIAGVGTYLAVDTGSAVVSREAAKEAGHNLAERAALVIDLFFENRSDGERFASNGPKYAKISWWKPRSVDSSSAPIRSKLAALDATLKEQGTL